MQASQPEMQTSRSEAQAPHATQHEPQPQLAVPESQNQQTGLQTEAVRAFHNTSQALSKIHSDTNKSKNQKNTLDQEVLSTAIVQLMKPLTDPIRQQRKRRLHEIEHQINHVELDSDLSSDSDSDSDSEHVFEKVLFPRATIPAAKSNTVNTNTNTDRSYLMVTSKGLLVYAKQDILLQHAVQTLGYALHVLESNRQQFRTVFLKFMEAVDLNTIIAVGVLGFFLEPRQPKEFIIHRRKRQLDAADNLTLQFCTLRNNEGFWMSCYDQQSHKFELRPVKTGIAKLLQETKPPIHGSQWTALTMQELQKLHAYVRLVSDNVFSFHFIVRYSPVGGILHNRFDKKVYMFGSLEDVKFWKQLDAQRFALMTRPEFAAQFLVLPNSEQEKYERLARRINVEALQRHEQYVNEHPNTSFPKLEFSGTELRRIDAAARPVLEDILQPERLMFFLQSSNADNTNTQTQFAALVQKHGLQKTLLILAQKIYRIQSSKQSNTT